MNTSETLKHIKTLSGTNAKLEYLRGLHDLDLLAIKSIATVALDNALSFHIKDINARYDDGEDYSISEFITLLYKLNDSGSCDRWDKVELSEIYTGLSDDGRYLSKLLLKRTLDCGLNIKSLRKVFGKEFLPDFPVGLCSSYDLNKINKNIKFPAISQLKSDGARCIALFGLGKCFNLRSRNGKPFHGLDNIRDALTQPNALDGDVFVMDGELVVLGDDGKILPRTTGNGILNKSVKGTITPEEASRVRFIVWDLIDAKSYFDDEISDNYLTRLNDLGVGLNAIDSDLIILTETKIVNNIKEAGDHYREMIQKGEEGTILKCGSGIWKAGRSTTQFKLKEVFGGEFKIIGWEFGTAGKKYADVIGKLKIATEDGLVVANCSGLSDAERGVGYDGYISEFFINNYLDMVCDVHYNARVKSKTSDIESLFLGRFKGLREDKTVADTRERLIEQENASRELGELR